MLRASGCLPTEFDDQMNQQKAIGPALARLVTALAASTALLVTVAVPLTYYHFGEQYVAGRMQAEATLQARLVSLP